MKEALRKICPPPVWAIMQKTRAKIFGGDETAVAQAGSQDLNVYWDPRMAALLETWGEGNAWNEIQLLMAERRARVLDIACGTGKVIEILSRFPGLEVHGCDISDMLLEKAAHRGLSKDRLVLTDATAMSYPDNAFDLGYSIVSLEHFTEEGIDLFLRECQRVVSDATFHMIPIARNGQDNGWIKTFQSYYNNSMGWWETKARRVYPRVQWLDSVWADEISVGKWLYCSKK